MSRLVYMNDCMVPAGEARVSVFDHGLLYGDGVFEGIRIYKSRPFKLKEHLDRLYEGARRIELTIRMDPEALGRAVEETVRANDPDCNYIRLVITRGVGDLGLDPRRCKSSEVIIIVDRIALYPAEFYESGLEMITGKTIRNHPLATPPGVKSLNYLNSILAKIEGARAGVPEVLMLNQRGQVCECTGDNIFTVRDGRVRTPPPEAGILEGITRNTGMELARGEGIDCGEADMTPEELYRADEIFLTGTAAEIVPVVRMDGRKIGDGRPGPVTRRLTELFRGLVNGAKGEG